MVAPLIGLAFGLGFTGLQELGKRKAVKAQETNDLERLAVLMRGGSLAPGQAGPPTPIGLSSGFTPREQEQLAIVGRSNTGEALALAEKFKVDRAGATQQGIDNANKSADLALRLQTNRLAQDRFGFDVEKFLFDKQGTERASADAQRALVDPEFAAERAAGLGENNYPVFDERRQSYGTAFLPGTDQFKAAEGAIVTTTQTLDDTSELRDLLRQVDVTGDPSALTTRRAQSLIAALQLQFKNIAELGIISETDFDQFISKIVPDATSVTNALISNPAAIDQALVQFTTEVQRANEVAVGNVSGWVGIRPELIQSAGQAQLRAGAQNQVAGRELQQDIDQRRQQQLIQEATGVGASSLDEQLLSRSLALRTLFGDTGQASERLAAAQAAGADPGLVPEGVLGQLGAGVIDNAGKIFTGLGAILGGRFAAGGARSR